MATITFDTLKFVTRLKESGLSDNQAIAITEAFRDAHSEAEVATKADLRETEMRLASEITLLKWMNGLIIGGIIALIVKTFFA